jgi:SsrA-binding protein
MGKKGGAAKSEAPRQIQNRKARHDYVIEETHEAGIVLVGSEVKSVYLGRAHLTDSYCRVVNDELWLHNFDIEPYEHSGHYKPERRRDRKLLMHRKEINLLERKAQEKGFTIVPLRAYFKRGKVKIEIGLGRGRKSYDKRDKIAADETRREAQAARSSVRGME